MAVLSSLVVCDDIVRTAAKEFSDGKGSANAQQSFARVLGGLDYGAYPHGVELATKVLLGFLDMKVGGATMRRGMRF